MAESDMAKIIPTRHGHVAGIHPERFRGRMDLALTELGRLHEPAGSLPRNG
jgi:broad specificity phosphatase PhoE